MGEGRGGERREGSQALDEWLGEEMREWGEAGRRAQGVWGKSVLVTVSGSEGRVEPTVSVFNMPKTQQQRPVFNKY